MYSCNLAVHGAVEEERDERGRQFRKSFNRTVNENNTGMRQFVLGLLLMHLTLYLMAIEYGESAGVSRQTKRDAVVTLQANERYSYRRHSPQL